MKQRLKQKLNAGTLQSREARQELAATLEQKFAELPDTETGPTDGQPLTSEWDILATTIANAVKDILGVLNRRHQDLFDDNSTEIHSLLRETNAARNRYLRQLTAANGRHWERFRPEVQRKLRTIQNNWWKTKAQEIQSYADTNDIQAFYESMKTAYGPIRGSLCPVWNYDSTSLIKDRDGILSRWTEHFDTLLNRRNPIGCSFLDNITSLYYRPSIAYMIHQPLEKLNFR
uniref:Uncharacterized protein n=1 Tax=Octopus bimaculoides TaxID=37653 RepID=A0A0L8FF39_OCTBM